MPRNLQKKIGLVNVKNQNKNVTNLMFCHNLTKLTCFYDMSPGQIFHQNILASQDNSFLESLSLGVDFGEQYQSVLYSRERYQDEQYY